MKFIVMYFQRLPRRGTREVWDLLNGIERLACSFVVRIATLSLVLSIPKAREAQKNLIDGQVGIGYACMPLNRSSINFLHGLLTIKR